MMDHSADDNPEPNTDDKLNHKVDRNMDHKPDTLIKQKELKEIKKDNNNRRHAFYRDNYGEIHAYVKNELSNWIAKLSDDYSH